MAKVFIGVGHGGADSGAVGKLVEKDVNLKMAKACRDYLKAHGVDVKISRECDENDPVGEEVKECNAFAPDLAIDVHNNSGGGDGFEVYHTVKGGKGAELAKNIESEVKTIGQNSRGCKTKKNSRGTDYYAFIRTTKCPAVICEGVFVDNAADAAQADTDAECKAFGEAYARGILKTLGISQSTPTPKPTQESSNNGFLVRVTCAALNIRAGAGTEHKIVGCIRDKGTYTIVATNGTWGKLKSGAGWISLNYTTRV